MQTQEKPTPVGLSEFQRRFYQAYGYLVLRQFFTPSEMATIRSEFEHALAEQYPHRPFDGTERHWAMMLEHDTPFFSSLLEDPRFVTAARQLYGEDVLGVAVDANRYVGDTGWHRDTVSALQYGIKFAFYLGDVEADTGALRVLPASHRSSDDPEFDQLMRSFGIGDVPAQALRSEPGDVIGFDLRLWHASLGGQADRRMCTVVYYADPKTAEEEAYLGRQGPQNVENSRPFGSARPYLYSRAWVENGAGSPDRQRWIDRLRGVGYFDAPGVVQK